MSRGGLSAGGLGLMALWNLLQVKAIDSHSRRSVLDSLMAFGIKSVKDSRIPCKRRLLCLFLLFRSSTCD